MNNRKQISAIDIVITLIYDIQLAKYEKEDTLILFINIKDAFNHISTN